MNKIGYQPTGVYSQFVKNPGMLARGDNKPAQPAPVVEPPKTGRKILKGAMELGVVAAVIGIGYCAHKFRDYYKQGLQVMQEKAARLPGINSESELQEFLEQRCYSEIEREDLATLFANSEKYTRNVVGKLNRKLTAFKNFFKNNFYNY